MQANVIHGADFAVHVGHADGLVAAGKFFGFVGTGEFGLGRNLDEWHRRSDSPAESRSFAALRMTRGYRSGFTENLQLRTENSGVSYFGCIVCATITWRLKFSIMCSSRRTSVGRLASVMVSILSWSLSSA